MGNSQCKTRKKIKIRNVENMVIQHFHGTNNNYNASCSCTKAELPLTLNPLNKEEQTEERKKKKAFRKRKRTRCNSSGSEESEENEAVPSPWVIQQERCSDNDQVYKPENQMQCQNNLSSETSERTYSVNNANITGIEFVESIDYENETRIKGLISAESIRSSPVIYRKKACKIKEENSENDVGCDSPTNSKCNVFQKRLMSESVLHTYSDDECTLKNLDLRCESDNEEISTLKLPGQSFEQEITEVKSTAHDHMLVNIDQMPSSGYPLVTDTEYVLTQGLSCDFYETRSETFDNLKVVNNMSDLGKEKQHNNDVESKVAKENIEHEELNVVHHALIKDSDNQKISNGKDSGCYISSSATSSNKKQEGTPDTVLTSMSESSKIRDSMTEDKPAEEPVMSSRGCEVQASHHVLVGCDSKELTASNKQNVARNNDEIEEHCTGLDKKDKYSDTNVSDIKDDLAEGLSEKCASFLKYRGDAENKSVFAEDKHDKQELDKRIVVAAKEKVKDEEINVFKPVVIEDSENKMMFNGTDSAYFTNSFGTSSIKGQESNTKIDPDTDNVTNVDANKLFLLNQGDDCQKNGISDSKQPFVFEHYDFIPIHSFSNPNLFAILIDEKDESNTSVIKISEKGLLQEVTLSQHEDVTENKFVIEACLDESNRGCKESVNKRKGNACSESDLCYTRKPGNPPGFCKSDLDLISDGRKTLLLTAPHEYHGLEIYRTECSLRRRTFSENDLSNLMNKHVPFFSKNVSQLDESNAASVPQHYNFREDKFIAFGNVHDISYSDSEKEEIAFAKFSKSIKSMPVDNGHRQKKFKKKKTKTVKPELSSEASLQLDTKSSSWTNKVSTKLRYKTKRKSKRSWTNSFSRHLKSKTPHELTVSFIDSGIGPSQSLNKSDSSTYTIVQRVCHSKHHSSLYSRRCTKRWSILLLKEKKSVKRLLTKNINKYFQKRRERNTKSIVRNLIGRPWTDPVTGVLDSYFQKYRNGQQPTLQERMQYEWIRFSTFQNYSGNGNTLALARNGFYHDHAEGPTSTRCFLCDARNSNWEMFDDVSAEHRRQSPNCPFHESSGQESVNISITYESNVSSPSAPTTTSGITSASGIVNARSTSTSSSTTTAAINEAVRNIQISQASQQGGESISQQPTEDSESDRSMLAVTQPRALRALGRTGHSYASIMAPTRNNVASGARSNVGVEPGQDVTRITSSQNPGIRPSSILGGPVGAGAFAGPETAVTRAKENLQQSNVPSPAVEAAAGNQQSNPAPGGGGRTDPNITVVVDNPKHPDYLNVDRRVNTYQGWPEYLDQTPRQMAEAGFFFVGVADFTRCFCCGGGLRNWEPGDDPVLEHTRWFPRCEYINKLKGERYVAVVQRRHEEHMAAQQRQQNELAQRRDQSRNQPDPMTIPAAITLTEMGYSAERTREAVLAVRQQTGQSIPSTEQVLIWLLDNEDRESGTGLTTELGVRPQPSVASSVASTTVGTSISSTVNTGTSATTTIVGTSIPSSIINTGTSAPTTIVVTSIPSSIINTGISAPTTIVGTSIPSSYFNTGASAPTTIVGTSIPSSIFNTGISAPTTIVGTSIPSSIFVTGFSVPSSIVVTTSIIGTPNVNVVSSTSQVSAGTTTSTVSSTSTAATPMVQPSPSASASTEGSMSATSTVSGSSSGSNGAMGTSTEKQSGATGDSDESKQAAKDASSSEPTNKKKKNGKKKVKNKAKSEVAGATGGDVDAKSLKAENEKLKEMQTCKICMEQAVNTTLLPCGHLVCCETCAGRLARCPICRKKIKGTVKTFMS